VKQLSELLEQHLEPVEVREAYRRWTQAPRSRKRRDQAFEVALPLVQKNARRLDVSNTADRQDLIQILSLHLFQLMFDYLPQSQRLPRLLSDNGGLAAYMDRALWNKGQEWLRNHLDTRSETFDFGWACKPPPHHRTSHPSDFLPVLLREQVRNFCREHVRKKNRLGGTLGEVVELMLDYEESGERLPDYQMARRGLGADQMSFVRDYVTVVKRMGLEELRISGGV
jgi:hypothetical protein